MSENLDFKLGYAEGYAAAQAKYQKRTQELEWENRTMANRLEAVEKAALEGPEPG